RTHLRSRGGCSCSGFSRVRAPPSVRTGRAHSAPGRPFRARGGCSYSGFIRVGAPPSVRTGKSTFCTREGFSHPGRVLLQRGDALGGTSTSSSAPRGAAHPRYANPRRNSHLGTEAVQLGCAFLFGFAALALDDHAYRAPQGFAAPLVAGAAEEAGVEVVEGFFELQVVVAQADEPF